MINVAVVGMGGIGNNHARCYQNNKAVQLVAVCDMIREKAEKSAQKLNCRAFGSIQEMLDSGLKIHAASMTTGGKENGGDHYQPTMDLLRAGIATLGEKPISNEISKAREMVALARQKNIPYAVNLNHRFTPAARQARKWLAEGRLGEVNILNMTMWINNMNESSPHFHMRALHPHSIDVMCYFGGDIRKVQAFFKKGAARKVWSNVQMNVLFADGAVGHLTGSYDAGAGYGLEQCDVVGSKGRVIIREACEVLEFHSRLSREHETYHYLGGMMGFDDTFQSRINAWVDDLVNQTPPDKIDGKAADALRAQLVIEAAIESWEKGTVVEVPAV